MKKLKSYFRREIVCPTICATTAMTSMMSSGMNMGYPAIALPVLTGNNTSITLNEDEQTWFASLLIITQIFGGVFSFFTMGYGRRVAIASGNVVAVTGWIVLATSQTVTQLLIARAIAGFSVGLCSSPSNIYLAETSTPQWIAIVTSLNSVALNIGLAIIYFEGFLLADNWRMVAVVALIVPILSTITVTFFLPESPRWLLSKGRKEQAKSALLKIRGLRTETPTIQKEFADMVRYSESGGHAESLSLNEGSPAVSSAFGQIVATLKLPEIWKPLLILNSYFFLQQFCGLYVLISYAVDIVQKLTDTVDPFLVTALIGVTQLIGGLFHVGFSSKIGRRPFSIVSSAGAFVSLAVLIIHTELFDMAVEVRVVCIFAYVASGSIGLIIVPWSMIGELYPTEFVNILGGVTVGVAALCNFVAVQTYPALSKYNISTALYVYAVVSFVSTLFMLFVLPETRGRTKFEIEENFKHKPLFMKVT